MDLRELNVKMVGAKGMGKWAICLISIWEPGDLIIFNVKMVGAKGMGKFPRLYASYPYGSYGIQLFYL